MKSPSDMISVIRPFLNRSLVQEFGHVYKFIVTDEDGVTSQYYLDLKNGNPVFCLQFDNQLRQCPSKTTVYCFTLTMLVNLISRIEKYAHFVSFISTC
jgi:hypothetical protein